jgi:hypothetical protein
MTAEPDGRTAIQSKEASGPAYAEDEPRADVAPSESADRVASNGNGEAHAPPEPPAAQAASSEPAADEPVASAAEPAAAEQPVAVEPVAAEQPVAVEPVAAEQPVAVEPVAAEEPSAEAPPAVTPDTERPAVGPKILGVAEPPKPLPTVKATLPTRKRRRRPSAAERHRRAFFSALTELRRGTAPAEQPAAEEQAQDAAPEAQPAAPEAQPAAPEAEAPEAQPAAPEAQPAAPEAEAPQPQAPAAQVDRSPASPARVTAAIERVGGAEVIKEALKPKQDEKGQPLKWAAVCAQAAEGMKPGDPVFNAWVRLAATPVREVKAQLPRPPEPERGGGRPGEPAARRPGGQRSGGRGDRPRRDDRQSRQEFASHAQDGTLRKSIRIVTGHDEDQERRERERLRKEQREAKRRAERERLARLGY